MGPPTARLSSTNHSITTTKRRQAWVDRVASRVASGAIDGAFIDGNRDGFASSITQCADDETKAAWADGLNARRARGVCLWHRHTIYRTLSSQCSSCGYLT